MKRLGVHREIERPESKYDQVETPEVPQESPQSANWLSLFVVFKSHVDGGVIRNSSWMGQGPRRTGRKSGRDRWLMMQYQFMVDHLVTTRLPVMRSDAS